MTTADITYTNIEKALPSDWHWVRLGDVATYINGRAFRPEDWQTSGVPIVRIQNLTSFDAPFNYYNKEVEPRYLINNGDLLISWSASLDAFIWNRGPAILNQHIFRVIENKEVVTRNYLYFVVRAVMEDIRRQVHGATMQHITRPEFEAVKILLPPLHEQHVIAAQLERDMTEVERLRAAVRRQREAVEALGVAYLHEIFESMDAQEWPIVRLGEVINTIQAGKSLKCEERPAKSEEWGVLKVSAVSWGEFKPDQNKVIPAQYVPPVEYEVQQDDLLISRANTTELVGAVVLVKTTRPRLMLSDKTLRLVPQGDRVFKPFLQLALASIQARKHIEDNATGASDSMKNISQDTIRSIPIPLPIIEEQRKIVQRLDMVMAEVAQLRIVAQHQHESVELLPATLMYEAFGRWKRP